MKKPKPRRKPAQSLRLLKSCIIHIVLPLFFLSLFLSLIFLYHSLPCVSHAFTTSLMH